MPALQNPIRRFAGYAATLLAVFSFSIQSLFAQAIQIDNQSQMDAFRDSGISEVDYLIVIESSLTNLDGLSNLTRVHQGLYVIENAALANLDGLRNLGSVGADIFIQENPLIENLAGMSSLTDTGNLTINGNLALASLEGLQSLLVVEGNCYIYRNGPIEDICPLLPLFSAGSIGGQTYIAYGDQIITDPTDLTHLQGCQLPGSEPVDPFVHLQELVDAGVLNKGQERALLAILSNSSSQALRNKVASLVRTGKLTEQQAQPFLDYLE